MATDLSQSLDLSIYRYKGYISLTSTADRVDLVLSYLFMTADRYIYDIGSKINASTELVLKFIYANTQGNSGAEVYVKVVADVPGTGSSKDGEAKQAPDGSAEPSDKGATDGSQGNQGDNSQGVQGVQGDGTQGVQGGGVDQDSNTAQLQFNNFQDQVDYAVHHALINKSGILTNTSAQPMAPVPAPTPAAPSSAPSQLVNPRLLVREQPQHIGQNVNRLTQDQMASMFLSPQHTGDPTQQQPIQQTPPRQQVVQPTQQTPPIQQGVQPVQQTPQRRQVLQPIQQTPLRQQVVQPIQQQSLMNASARFATPGGQPVQHAANKVVLEHLVHHVQPDGTMIPQAIPEHLEQFGLRPKDAANLYRQPYPEWFERVPLPNLFKVPDFSKFLGQDSTSTYEHVSRFLAQCGEASAVDALRGMIAPIREKFSSEDFESLSHLTQKVTLHEQRFAEARKNSRKVNHVCPYIYGSDDEDDDSEIAAAEWVRSKKVIPCQWVKNSRKDERYDFDITKPNKIFDLLLREKHIQLPAGHTIPSAKELGKKRPMKVDGNPFPVNMVHTAGRTADEGRARGFQVNSAKIINKYQRKYDKQQEKHYEEDDDGFDPHWGCEFFRFCWNEAMKLPSIEDCPGCCDIAENSSRSYSRGNRLRQTRVPVHQRLGPVNQDHGQEDNENMKTQWCPSGIFTKNQKRRKTKPRQEWRVKNQVPVADEATADEARRLAKGKSVVTASVNMVFTLPAEFGVKQADVDEVEEESAKLTLSPDQTVFEKPEGTEHRHLKPLYINGYVNGKPMSKMMVDGGAAVNLMPYTTFRKLGRNAEDLIKTNLVLKDFGGNPSETKGVLNVELTVGNKTIPTTLFVIDGKGSYSLLLGRDWIHTNCCIPSTMHQCLIQWQGDKIEIVPADSQLKMENPSYYFEGVMEGSNVYTKDTVDDLDDKQGQGFMSADDLEEIDIGPGDRPRPTFISKNLSSEFRTKLIELLKEFRDCFAWEYYEMPGLSQSIVEHQLPIKPGVRPHQQPPRRCKADMLEPVKAEIKRLDDAGFIRPCRYAEWVSSIVPVIKQTARCPGAIGLFEWVVMTFGLKSAGATYQRAMNYIYHDLIGWLVEVYIDDVVVKSKEIEDHIADLRKVFERTRKYGLKMNPTKCAFGVSTGQFLGFLVHERGIEVTQRSVNAIKKIQPPENKTELQEMIGKIKFVRRFISNLSGRLEPFTPLLRLKADQQFTWRAEQHKALDDIKEYLSSPPVLIPPQKREFEGKMRVVFYLSRRLLDAETRLRHYLLSNECTVICKADIVKYMLSAPILKGMVGKWIFSLTEFDLPYESPKAIKGQAIADFIVEHRDDSIGSVEILPWTLFFDGSVCTHGCGIGLVIISPRGASFEFAYTIKSYATNNQAEYEAVLKGLQLLKEVEADAVEIMGDSLLVISQLAGEYECKNDTLMIYNEKCQELIKEFRLVTLKHVSREQNIEANDLAQGASGYRPMIKDVKVEVAAITADDWRIVSNITKGVKIARNLEQFSEHPASAMNPIIKPWPFRGWGIDMISMINPPSSKGHKFILVATDYFTKWVEAIPLKKVDSGDAKQFVQEHLIYRFGIPQTITTDQGSIFVSDEFVQFADNMGIKLLNSSPYYAQVNGQAEASNKSLIKLIKRKISYYPRQWHTRLAEALWSYRMACHGSIQVPPYKLVYGHEAVLPWEVRIGSRRTELQDNLTIDEYYNLMADEREDLVQSRLRALAKVTKDKERVARHYNKKVVLKDFSEGELVWKLILLIGTRDSKFGK
uniref:Retrotransposon protein, putative, unclassified n=1 Tax=Oryza sativa subsp. japonica TaxID=39947 RepID=Q10I05_ORYSJ|nr:retrotransposon protein, putative, unclassified [Oryza sativa Japonica Group]